MKFKTLVEFSFALKPEEVEQFLFKPSFLKK